LWYLFRLTIGCQIILSFSKIHFGSLNCNFWKLQHDITGKKL
jgi:hypothetical protein